MSSLPPRIIRKANINEKLRTQILKDHRKAKKSLSEDFGRRCAYCMRHESSLGGYRAFEIDHFFPESLGGSNEYTNLYYVCRACNGIKLNKWPPGITQQELPVLHSYPNRPRFADPCREQDYGYHFVEDDSGHLVACTRAGAFHLEALWLLNAADLVEERLERNELRQKIDEAKEVMIKLHEFDRTTQAIAQAIEVIEKAVAEYEGDFRQSVPQIPCCRPAMQIARPSTCESSCQR